MSRYFISEVTILPEKAEETAIKKLSLNNFRPLLNQTLKLKEELDL